MTPRGRFRPLLLLASLAACRGTEADDPGSVVQRFYAAAMTLGHSGAPSPADLARLAPYLSDSLQALLRAAHARTEADLKRAPDEKPAFAEGDLYSSLFEGPSEVAVLADSTRGAAHAVITRMSFDGDSTAINWTDTVLVVREHGRFVITDIIFGGNWEFANHGTLATNLAATRAGH